MGWVLLLRNIGCRLHGLQQRPLVGLTVVTLGLQSTGSVVMAHRLSFPAARGIFPD